MSFSWSRLGAWFVVLIAGGLYGLAGTIAQSYILGVLPLGLVLALLGSAALLVAVRLLSGDRWAALAAAVGMIAAAVVFSGRGPGGSVIVPQAADGTVSTGIVWSIALPLLAAIIIAWPDLSRLRAQPVEAAPDDTARRRRALRPRRRVAERLSDTELD